MTPETVHALAVVLGDLTMLIVGWVVFAIGWAFS